MDLINRLEALRFSDEALQSTADEANYWELMGANNMLDNCLEIIWKWIREHHLELELST